MPAPSLSIAGRALVHKARCLEGSRHGLRNIRGQVLPGFCDCRRRVLSGMAVHVVRIARRPAECVGLRASVTRCVCDEETQYRAQHERRDQVACSPASFRPLRGSLRLLWRALLLVPGFLAHSPRLREACKKDRSYLHSIVMSRIVRGSRAPDAVREACLTDILDDQASRFTRGPAGCSPQRVVANELDEAQQEDSAE